MQGSINKLLFHYQRFEKTAEMFQTFLPAFGRLRVLDVSRSSFNDECLESVAIHCPELR